MNITTKDLRDGSCNFCSRGEHGSIGECGGVNRMTYPYSEVIEITRGSNSGLSANICVDCAKELSNYIEANTSDHLTK